MSNLKSQRSVRTSSTLPIKLEKNKLEMWFLKYDVWNNSDIVIQKWYVVHL